MTSATETQIRPEGIGHALSDSLLAIPSYQRSYAWTDAHVSALLKDLTHALDTREPEYFLGSIVCTRTQDKLEVVDGQQRLATASILIAAVRDYFVDEGDEDRAGDLEKDFLFKRDLKSQEIRPRLRLNDMDNGFWEDHILGRGQARTLEPTKTSHRRLRDAAKLARKHVDSLAGTTNDPVSKLSDLIDYIKDKARVIWLQARNDANAFILFETLNDRGLELAISDLLKNYLFLRAGDRIAEAQASWITMTGILEAVADDSAVKEFIRYYWSSSEGATRERELYQSLKKGISSKKRAVQFSQDLAKGARLYAAVLNPEHEFWKPYGATARGHMATINLLGMKQVRPLLLAIFSTFTAAQTKRALRLIVAMGVRFLVTGGLGGGVMERHYCEAAIAVRTGTVKTAVQLRKELGGVVPTDKEFEEGFRVARVSKAYLARYYLRALERQKRGETNPELVPNPNADEVNLEHVLPRSPEKNWPDYTDEDVKTWSRRLGNLVLLKVDENDLAGNEAFKDKKPVLKKSKYKLTKLAGNKKEWKPRQIEARQDALAKLAVLAWPLKGK